MYIFIYLYIYIYIHTYTSLHVKVGHTRSPKKSTDAHIGQFEAFSPQGVAFIPSVPGQAISLYFLLEYRLPSPL